MNAPMGQRIKERMQQLGIKTNIKLADVSGVSRAVITNVVRNENKSVMLDSAMKLARALNCRVEWLYDGSGDVNDDETRRIAFLRDGAPVIALDELAGTTSNELIELLYSEEFRERRPCPSGNSTTTFIVRSPSNFKHYSSGSLLYFDSSKKPTDSDIVLIRTNKDQPPSIMEFFTNNSDEYVKVITREVPDDMAFSKLKNPYEIVATLTSSALIC